MQTPVFKEQVEWIQLSTGSVRQTQGRTLGLARVSGGSQSYRHGQGPTTPRSGDAYLRYTQSAVGSLGVHAVHPEERRGRGRAAGDVLREQGLGGLCAKDYIFIIREHFDLF